MKPIEMVSCDFNKAAVVLETERLLLREMNMDDYEAIHSVLADPDNMQHYPCVFDESKVRDCILTANIRMKHLSKQQNQ